MPSNGHPYRDTKTWALIDLRAVVLMGVMVGNSYRVVVSDDEVLVEIE